MAINDNVSLFYNAKPHIFEKAKALRKDSFSENWEESREKKPRDIQLRVVRASLGVKPGLNTIDKNIDKICQNI